MKNDIETFLPIDIAKKILGSEKFSIFISILLFIQIAFHIGLTNYLFITQPETFSNDRVNYIILNVGTENWWMLSLCHVILSLYGLLLVHYFNPNKNIKYVSQFMFSFASYVVRFMILCDLVFWFVVIFKIIL